MAGNSPPARTSVERDHAKASISSGRMAHRDALPLQIGLEHRDRDVSRMKHAGRQRTVHVGLFEYLGEVLNLSRAAGCDQRHVAHHANRPQLIDVVAAAHPLAVHTVEHDLPGAPALGLDPSTPRSPTWRTTPVRDPRGA